MDAVYIAANLQICTVYVPVVSTLMKLVLNTASDRQEDLVRYFIQPVTFSLFICMECVSIAVKASMMELVFEECCRSINGYICYGTILYDCVYYSSHGNRKVHKKAQKGNICSACFTLWKFKRKVVQETVIDGDGNASVKTRISIRDPPIVTFREGMAMDHLTITKPQPFIPSNPTPATISIRFTPTSIHPWYRKIVSDPQ
jgi:hypothetical protein